MDAGDTLTLLTPVVAGEKRLEVVTRSRLPNAEDVREWDRCAGVNAAAMQTMMKVCGLTKAEIGEIKRPDLERIGEWLGLRLTPTLVEIEELTTEARAAWLKRRAGGTLSADEAALLADFGADTWYCSRDERWLDLHWSVSNFKREVTRVYCVRDANGSDQWLLDGLGYWGQSLLYLARLCVERYTDAEGIERQAQLAPSAINAINVADCAVLDVWLGPFVHGQTTGNGDSPSSP